MELVLTAVFMERFTNLILSDNSPYDGYIFNKERGRTYWRFETADSFKIVRNNLLNYIYKTDPHSKILVIALHPIENGVPIWDYSE
jgi:hypothetical protein